MNARLALAVAFIAGSHLGAFAAEIAGTEPRTTRNVETLPRSDLSPILHAGGAPLSVDDLNTGLTPKKGYYVWHTDDPKYCVVENVRSVESLPASVIMIRQIMKDLSLGRDGRFAEAVCWVFYFGDGNLDFECARGSSKTSLSGVELNSPLQSLFKRSRSAKYIKNVLMIHTHPTDFDTRHFGPSPPDLASHYNMEQQFEKVHGLPLGSYLSLIFPVDKENKTDFFYSVNSFKSVGENCPKNPGE